MDERCQNASASAVFANACRTLSVYHGESMALTMAQLWLAT